MCIYIYIYICIYIYIYIYIHACPACPTVRDRTCAINRRQPEHARERLVIMTAMTHKYKSSLYVKSFRVVRECSGCLLDQLWWRCVRQKEARSGLVPYSTMFTSVLFAGRNWFGSIRFGSGLSTIHRFGSVRFGKMFFSIRRGSACFFRTHCGSVRFGTVRFRVRFWPVPKLYGSVGFGSVRPVRFGFLFLPVYEVSEVQVRA